MKRLGLMAVATFAMVAGAQAACVGDANFSVCRDSSGNSYTTNRVGDMSFTRGRNSSTGNTWSQTTTDFGDSSYTTGRAANGNSWRMRQYDLGGGSSSYSGTDSNGDYFSGTCIGGRCN